MKITLTLQMQMGYITPHLLSEWLSEKVSSSKSTLISQPDLLKLRQYSFFVTTVQEEDSRCLATIHKNGQSLFTNIFTLTCQLSFGKLLPGFVCDFWTEKDTTRAQNFKLFKGWLRQDIRKNFFMEMVVKLCLQNEFALRSGGVIIPGNAQKTTGCGTLCSDLIVKVVTSQRLDK